MSFHSNNPLVVVWKCPQMIFWTKGHLSSNKGTKMLQYAKIMIFFLKPISYSQDQMFLFLGNWLSQQHHAHVNTWLLKRWAIENKGFWNHGMDSRRGKGTHDRCGRRPNMHPLATTPNANIVASCSFQVAFVVVDSLICKTITTATLINTTLHHTPLCKVGGPIDLKQTFKR
jgi:hypothetical protein